MPETVTIHNPSLKSRLGYVASTLFMLCIIFVLFYGISILKGRFVLNFDTDKQIVTIICLLVLVYSFFKKHIASIRFDFSAQTVTLKVLRVLTGGKTFIIPFDDFFYYEEQRRVLSFRDRLYFYRGKKELAGVWKRNFNRAQLQELKATLQEVEKLYPEEA